MTVRDAKLSVKKIHPQAGTRKIAHNRVVVEFNNYPQWGMGPEAQDKNEAWILCAISLENAS